MWYDTTELTIANRKESKESEKYNPNYCLTMSSAYAAHNAYFQAHRRFLLVSTRWCTAGG
jgi:hypothetical protein